MEARLTWACFLDALSRLRSQLSQRRAEARKHAGKDETVGAGHDIRGETINLFQNTPPDAAQVELAAATVKINTVVKGKAAADTRKKARQEKHEQILNLQRKLNMLTQQGMYDEANEAKEKLFVAYRTPVSVLALAASVAELDPPPAGALGAPLAEPAAVETLALAAPVAEPAAAKMPALRVSDLCDKCCNISIAVVACRLRIV